ncbi:LysR substrate-binding domain-containing protein [Kitasatospora sp. NBC_01266]|uniref:LysR substrate-binding domain-containing protein n=1 Tax=Kitasatospora sp. NBC_01266 TaxID=2903572 RepID=UPI002E30B9A2|nr:LysR substrate-binding domain-containing protein [Kitasatospora sp. NBC_01266]
MIDVQRLRILREVARHGSFNRAATALLLTPSAVSQQIAALERTLGTAVVERSTRGVTLTEPGRLLVEAAEAINAELHHAQEQIDRLALARPRLTVATFTSGGRQLLPAALSRFVAEHPEVELTVLEGEPEQTLPMVREGRADLALAYHFDLSRPFRPGDRSGLDWTPLLVDPLSVVLPRDHRLADRAGLELAELMSERWVLGCLKTRALLAGYAERAGFEPAVAAATTDYFFAQALVGAGVGVSLIPGIALVPPTPELAVVPLDPPGPARHIGVATARRARPQPLAGALLAALVRSAAAAR